MLRLYHASYIHRSSLLLDLVVVGIYLMKIRKYECPCHAVSWSLLLLLYRTEYSLRIAGF
jgi:hypothetical protein